MLKAFLEEAPEINIRFSNLTSETQVTDGVKMNGAALDSCMLQLPKSSCSIGHQVLITLLINTKGLKKKKMEIVGKVLEINLTSDNSSEVKVQFNQYIKEEWLSLLGLFEQRQEQISKVIEELKTPKP